MKPSPSNIRQSRVRHFRSSSKSNAASSRRATGAKTSAAPAGRGTSRLEQVVDVLKRVLTWREPADVTLSHYFREHRTLGSRDRAQVADAVFDVLRHLRRYRHEAQSWAGSLEQALAIKGLYHTQEPDAAAKVLDADQLSWVSLVRGHGQESETGLTFGLRFSLPAWIEQALELLPEPESYAAALLQSAPLDLRVNTLKATRDEVLDQLSEQLQGSGVQAMALPYAPDGIRLSAHLPVNRWDLFTQGVIEVQDEGSQLLTQLVAAKRGEMVIDFCAGAGGKTLALGALMRSTGRLYAFDVSAARLSRAKPRLARSGLSNVHPVVIRNERDDRVARLAGKAHRVLVDAPCTGLGTLRRNPDLKWRQSPESLSRLCEQQASILTQAARCVRPGGRLVYATCSFLVEENEQQVMRFLDKNPDFSLLNATDCLNADLTNSGSGEHEHMMRVRPDWHGTDGFFAAVMQKRA